jgi:uncharacterized repeat protein (TIGR01451 family)
LVQKVKLNYFLRACLSFLIAIVLSTPAVAGTCFAIDDDTGVIITYDSDAPFVQRFNTTIQTSAVVTSITERFESAYFDSVSNRYYVVYQGTPNVFGYVRPNDGVFVPLGTSLGSTAVPTVVTPSGNGAGGIRGLTRNPVDNKWYAIDQNGFLFELNPITGGIVSGAFGGNDYIRVLTPAGATVNNIEDLAFDNTGQLFVIRNDPGADQLLRNINLTTGLAASGVNLGLDEAEGLTNALGDIRVIVGAFGAGSTPRNFYSLNTATGALTLLFNVPSPTGTPADFESSGCNDGVLRADLKLSKSVAPTAVAPGGTATFVLRIEHEGIDIAHRIQVQETLPFGMTVISSAQGPGCVLCSYDIPTNLWSIDKLDIGQVRTLSLVVSTSGITPDSFVLNRAQINQSCQAATGPCVPLTDIDSTPANKSGSSWLPTEDDEATAGLLVTALPSVAKSFSPATGLAGQTTTLILTFTNPNSSSAATITSAFTDAYPTGLFNAATPNATTTCAGTGAITAVAGAASISLGAGRIIPAAGSCQLSVVLVANSLGNYTNTVSPNAITTTIPGLTLSNTLGATAIYQVTPDNVGIIKDFTPDGIGAGQTSTLKLTLSNPRNVTATLLSVFEDFYPANVFNAVAPNPQTTCIGGAATAPAGGNSLALNAGAQIAPGGSCIITAVVTSSVFGFYTNTIPAGSLSTSVGSNLGAPAAVIQVANPSVSKVFDPASTVPGGTSTLRITFTNPRNTTATFTTPFVDIYPTVGAGAMVNVGATNPTNTCGGLATGNAGSNQIVLNTANRIPPLSSCVVTVVVTTTPASASGTFVNTIPAGSLTTNLGPSTVPATATLTVSAQTNLSVTKQVSAANIFPGTTLTYTVTVTNLGPNVAFNAILSDVAQGLNLIAPVTSTQAAGTGTLVSLVTSTSQITATMDLAVNGVRTFVFRGLPNLANGFVTNTASVSPGPTATDAISINNSASVNTRISPSVNLSVFKTNGTNTLVAGSNSIYTVTFINNGPSDASGALIRDIPSVGLSNCTVLSCTGTGGAFCGAPTFTALNTSGYSLPTFPSGSSVNLQLQCSVSLTGL